DSVRLEFDEPWLYAQAAAGQMLANETDRTRNIQNYWFLASTEPIRRERLTGYLLDQEHTDSSDYGIYYAPSYRGQPIAGLEPWALGTILRGKSEDIGLDAYAADAGATYVLPVDFEPSITAGWAIGSGDVSTRDTKNRDFQQTGFEDNRVFFNNETRLNGY